MKRLFASLVLLLCFLPVLPSLAQDIETDFADFLLFANYTLDETTLDSLDEDYTSDNGHLTLSYPEDWDIDDIDNEGIDLRPDGDDYEDIEDVLIRISFVEEDTEELGITVDTNAEDAMDTFIDLVGDQLGVDDDDVMLVQVGENRVASIELSLDGEFVTYSIVETKGGLIFVLLQASSGEELNLARQIYFTIISTMLVNTDSAGGGISLTESYTSNNDELTFDYPEDWDVEEGDGYIGITPDSDDYEDIEDITIEFYFVEGYVTEFYGIEADDDLEDAADDFADYLTDAGLEIFGPDEYSIGDFDAVFITTNLDDNDIILFVLLDTGDGLLLVQMYGPGEQLQLDLAVDVFFAVVGSVDYDP